MNKLKIINKRELSPNVYELELHGDCVNNFNTPGQFIHIKVPRNDLLLRRPISIAKIDKDNMMCTIVIKGIGEGTQAIVNSRIGETLDALGPLGNGFPIQFLNPNQKVLLIGGGIGCPPLLECAKQLHVRDIQCTSVLGFVNKESVFYEDDFKQYGKVFISTDDGSYQTKGNVKAVIDQLDETFDAIYACGPTGLVRMVNQVYENHPHAYISLEERMACGVGACAGCTVKKKRELGNFKVCSDGPVFKTGEVLI